MKLILIAILLGLVNGLPTEEKLESIKGEPGFVRVKYMSEWIFSGRGRPKPKKTEGSTADFTRYLEEIGRDGLQKYGLYKFKLMAKHFRDHLEIDYPGKWSCFSGKTKFPTTKASWNSFRIEVGDFEVACVPFETTFY